MIYDANMLGELTLEFQKAVQELNKRNPRVKKSFMDWLEKTDFYRAPASTKHHGNYEGGLLEHSLNVYHRIMKMAEDSQKESAALVALFHDLCKIGTYQIGYRNAKQPDGSWKRVPYYTYDTDFPMGHGEKSVYLLMKHGVDLTDEEALAIRWHMGAFDDSVQGGCRDFNFALEYSPLVLMLHQADMQASYWDER